MNTKHLTVFAVVAVLITAGAVGTVALANHSWGGYHWARTANPLVLKIGDNVSAGWDSYLATASTDWSTSTVLDTTVVPGLAKPKNCRATAGRVEVCNSKYGKNGWLGIASIWISGTHITQGTVRLNDTYFATAKYNTPAWKNLVACQEIGHTLGLDHQDEIFDNLNLGTCMDYTNDPSTNQHPNLHDYEMLEIIYEHLDSFTSATNTVASRGNKNVDTENPSEWGKSIRTSRDGKSSLFERNLGNGEKLFTFVIWAE